MRTMSPTSMGSGVAPRGPRTSGIRWRQRSMSAIFASAVSWSTTMHPLQQRPLCFAADGLRSAPACERRMRCAVQVHDQPLASRVAIPPSPGLAHGRPDRPGRSVAAPVPLTRPELRAAPVLLADGGIAPPDRCPNPRVHAPPRKSRKARAHQAQIDLQAAQRRPVARRAAPFLKYGTAVRHGRGQYPSRVRAQRLWQMGGGQWGSSPHSMAPEQIAAIVEPKAGPLSSDANRR
jgi:hypothetical protein